MSEVGDAKNVILDLSAIQRLDTAGAWVIDRARAELAEAGVSAAYRGARPEHALLIKEAGYRPFEAAKDVRPSHGLVLLSAVGETVYKSGEDFADIVDYLGEIVMMLGRLPCIRCAGVGPRWFITSSGIRCAACRSSS